MPSVSMANPQATAPFRGNDEHAITYTTFLNRVQSIYTNEDVDPKGLVVKEI